MLMSTPPLEHLGPTDGSRHQSLPRGARGFRDSCFGDDSLCCLLSDSGLSLAAVAATEPWAEGENEIFQDAPAKDSECKCS